MHFLIPVDYRGDIKIEANDRAVALKCCDGAGNVWRCALAPGDEVSGASAAVLEQIGAAWTPERVAAYQATVVSYPDLPAEPPTPTVDELMSQIARLGARLEQLERGGGMTEPTT